MTTDEHARPFVTFHIGQAGVQIGNAIWELMCLEHNINPDGSAKAECSSNGFYDAMFTKSSTGHFMPRTVIVDTDPTCINEIRMGPYRDMFVPNQLLSGHNDAGFNYMCGRHGFKSSLMPDTVERFRWLLEKTDATPTVFLVHGISGGTGSGLAVSCLEALQNDFGNSLQVLDLNVCSGRSGLQSSCELLNQVLYAYESRDFTALTMSVTNSAMFNICRTGMSLTSATYAHLNRMLAMCFSNITAMERYPGTLTCNVSSICSNVVPFKHLKHVVLACAPFTSDEMAGKDRLNPVGVTSIAMEPESQFADLDLRYGRHMAGVLLYRGAAKPSDIEQCLASLKSKSRIDFNEWAPVGFRTGLIELPPLSVPGSGIGSVPLSVTLVSNHTSVSSLFRGQSENVKKLAAGKYFLHSYELADMGSHGSGHNSAGGNITSLLKEACDHMDEIATVYENEQPQGQAQSAPVSSLPKRTSMPASRRCETRGSGIPGGGRDTRKLDADATDAPRSQVGETPPAAGAHGPMWLQGRRKSGEAEDPARPQGPKATPTADADRLQPSPYADVQFKPRQEGEPYLPGNFEGTEENQPPPQGVELQEQQQQQQQQLYDPNQEFVQRVASDTSMQGRGEGTTTEESSRVTISQGQQPLTPTPAVSVGPKKSASKPARKRGSSGCCRRKSTDKAADPEQQKGGKAQSQPCCGKRNPPKERRHRSRQPNPAAALSQPAPAEQTQNHARPMSHYHSSDTESCRSANCAEQEAILHCDGAALAGTERVSVRLHPDESSMSTHSVDSSAELSEIVRNCRPGSLTVDATIQSVKQIIEKYNRLFESQNSPNTDACSRK